MGGGWGIRYRQDDFDTFGRSGHQISKLMCRLPMGGLLSPMLVYADRYEGAQVVHGYWLPGVSPKLNTPLLLESAATCPLRSYPLTT